MLARDIRNVAIFISTYLNLVSVDEWYLGHSVVDGSPRSSSGKFEFRTLFGALEVGESSSQPYLGYKQYRPVFAQKARRPLAVNDTKSPIEKNTEPQGEAACCLCSSPDVIWAECLSKSHNYTAASTLPDNSIYSVLLCIMTCAIARARLRKSIYCVGQRTHSARIISYIQQ